MKALAIEPDPLRRRFVQKILEAHGFEFVGSQDVDGALEAIHRESFTLVVCGHRPREIDGVSACRQIRDVSFDSTLLLVSWCGPVPSTDDVLDSGADQFVRVDDDPTALALHVGLLSQRLCERSALEHGELPVESLRGQPLPHFDSCFPSKLASFPMATLVDDVITVNPEEIDVSAIFGHEPWDTDDHDGGSVPEPERDETALHPSKPEPDLGLVTGWPAGFAGPGPQTPSDASVSNQAESGGEPYRTLVETTSTTVGPAYFKSLVRCLATALGVRVAFVAEVVEPERTHARVLAISIDGEDGTRFEMPIAGIELGNEATSPLGSCGWLADLDIDVDGALVSPLLGSDGERIGVLGVADSEHLRIDDAQVELIRLLSLRARAEIERARDTEKLQGVVEAARSAHRAADDLLVDVSHEMRAPLHGAIEAVESLLQTALTETQRELAEAIRFGGETQLEILDALLDAQRLRAASSTNETSPIDLRQIVENAMRLPTIEATKKGLSVVLRYAESAPRHVSGDPRRIRRVLTNLVGNAVAVTSQGKVVVNVRCEERSEYEATLRFSITDTGPGISEDRLSHVFDAYSGTSGSKSGSGLGLSISKQIVEHLGGRIGVTSRIGEGSTFWFTLALPLRSTAAEPSKEPAAGSPPQASGRGHVLVIDESLMTIKVTTKMLSDLGCSVDSATTESEAIALADTRRYDVIFVGCRTEAMDGPRITAEIRRRENGERRVPIVMMTTEAAWGERERCIQAGVDDYVSKPLTRDDLRTVLTRWARRPAAGSSGPTVGRC